MAGNCEDGMECMKAHNLCELRVLAAIEMGLVDMAFKTNLCKAYEASQDCQRGNFNFCILTKCARQMPNPNCWHDHFLQTLTLLHWWQGNSAQMLMAVSSCDLRQQCSWAK